MAGSGLTLAAPADEPDAALGELRAPGWPAPEDPGRDDNAELDGRDLSGQRAGCGCAGRPSWE